MSAPRAVRRHIGTGTESRRRGWTGDGEGVTGIALLRMETEKQMSFFPGSRLAEYVCKHRDERLVAGE